MSEDSKAKNLEVKNLKVTDHLEMPEGATLVLGNQSFGVVKLPFTDADGNIQNIAVLAAKGTI